MKEKIDRCITIADHHMKWYKSIFTWWYFTYLLKNKSEIIKLFVLPSFEVALPYFRAIFFQLIGPESVWSNVSGVRSFRGKSFIFFCSFFQSGHQSNRCNLLFYINITFHLGLSFIAKQFAFFGCKNNFARVEIVNFFPSFLHFLHNLSFNFIFGILWTLIDAIEINDLNRGYSEQSILLSR